jgi:hypothetical protein
MGLCIFALAASVPRANADDDDPVIKGKKVSEWIAELKTGKSDQVMSALEAIGPNEFGVPTGSKATLLFFVRAK